MNKVLVGSLALALGIFLGYAFRPIIDWGVDQSRGGPSQTCILRAALCKGQSITEFSPATFEDQLGGLLDVTCGFERPGDTGREGKYLRGPEKFADMVQTGCRSERYVASFSNGRRLINLWVDKGVIVQIDDYPRHVIDL